MRANYIHVINACNSSIILFRSQGTFIAFVCQVSKHIKTFYQQRKRNRKHFEMETTESFLVKCDV